MKNTTNYFRNVRTAEELKKAYRDLAKKLHPDMPTGNAEEFKAMQNEYERLWSTLKNVHMNKEGETYVHETDEKASEYMDIINVLIKFKGCLIEVIGSWIWVSGDTKEYKETLKGMGFKFSGKKVAWYYHKGEYVKKSKNKFNMDDLRKMYGTTEYHDDDDNNAKVLKSAN